MFWGFFFTKMGWWILIWTGTGKEKRPNEQKRCLFFFRLFCLHSQRELHKESDSPLHNAIDSVVATENASNPSWVKQRRMQRCVVATPPPNFFSIPLPPGLSKEACGAPQRLAILFNFQAYCLMHVPLAFIFVSLGYSSKSVQNHEQSKHQLNFLARSFIGIRLPLAFFNEMVQEKSPTVPNILLTKTNGGGRATTQACKNYGKRSNCESRGDKNVRMQKDYCKKRVRIEISMTISASDVL